MVIPFFCLVHAVPLTLYLDLRKVLWFGYSIFRAICWRKYIHLTHTRRVSYYSISRAIVSGSHIHVLTVHQFRVMCTVNSIYRYPPKGNRLQMDLVASIVLIFDGDNTTFIACVASLPANVPQRDVILHVIGIRRLKCVKYLIKSYTQ